MKSIVEEVKENIRDMKPVSANTTRIINLVSTTDYKIGDLLKLIEMDVSLSTQCLRILNSAAYSLRTPIMSIDRAVSYLGRKVILDLVIQLGFNEIYSVPLEGYKGEQEALWEHSLRTAIASRLLVQSSSHKETADVAYTAGLLHDIGKIIISHFLAKQPSDTLKMFDVGGEIDFTTMESQMLETNHAEVGYMMAVHWKLPDLLQMVIRYHHEPSKAPTEFKRICFAVHLGDILAMMGGYGTGCDTLAYRVDPEFKMYFNSEMSNLEKLLIDIDTEFREVLHKTLLAQENTDV